MVRIGIAVFAFLFLVVQTNSLGAAAKEERRRTVLITPGGDDRRVTTADLADPGARVLASYDAMQALSITDDAFDRVLGRLVSEGFEFQELDSAIRTPRQTIRPGDEPEPATLDRAGLFILQYIAPPTAEWQQIVLRSGVAIVESLPGQSVLIAANSEQVGQLRTFGWVGYLGPYLPAYKFAPVVDDKHTEFTIQMVATELSLGAISDVKELTGGFVTESTYGSQMTARIRADLKTVQALLENPFVIGVEAHVPPSPSDERQALSLTGAMSPTGGNYLGWLAAHGITPNALTQSGIVVNVADTGVDQGCLVSAFNAHRDLTGRLVYFTDLTGQPQRRDSNSHGTTVAGIVGANPVGGINSVGAATTGYGLRDNDSYGQFYYGLGVAPGIRIGSTLMATNFGPGGTVADWTRLAVSQDCNTPTALCPNPPTWVDPTPNCRATVQNFSNNEYHDTGATSGIYTLNAREMDISVRNADRTTMTPLAITVSAGNYLQRPLDPTTALLPPATAKNVISVGATESARDVIQSCLAGAAAGENPTIRNLAQGYDVLAYTSRRGTTDGRLKPDLVAPATLSFGPRTTAAGSNAFCGTAGDFYQNGIVPVTPAYHGGSGTSFAAPVAAGAVALLRYHYSAVYGLTPSPAMYKAMLIAGSNSITGALDRQETAILGTTRTVTKWPNAQQGFGLIDLSELLSPAVVKSWHDQGTVLLQGQMYQRTVTVADHTKPMRVVLAWTDAPAAAGAAITEVNGLNLTGLEFFGNFVGTDGYSRPSPGCGRPVCPSPSDSRNNVEVLNISPAEFSDPSRRTFTLKVMASPLNGVGVPGQSGGLNNQDFALFVLNGTLQ